MQKKDPLEERIELSMLYDFYGALLKDNQQQIFEAYMLDDFSITEIAQDLGITRQGVHDSIKRTTRQLRLYEEKLGLVERFEQQKENIRILHQQLQQLEIDQTSPQWSRIFDTIHHIVEDAEQKES